MSLPDYKKDAALPSLWSECARDEYHKLTLCNVVSTIWFREGDVTSKNRMHPSQTVCVITFEDMQHAKLVYQGRKEIPISKAVINDLHEELGTDAELIVKQSLPSQFAVILQVSSISFSKVYVLPRHWMTFWGDFNLYTQAQSQWQLLKKGGRSDGLAMCTFCGQLYTHMKRCGECGTWYCNKTCQTKDWKVHRHEH